MDKSCFYKARLRDSVALPFLLMEVVGEKFASAQDVPLEQLLNEACVICYGPDHAVDLEKLAMELHSVAEAGSEGNEKDSPPPKKSLGTDYMQWLSKLDPPKICLMLSEWDMDKAEYLYCVADHRDVRKMSELFVELEWKKIQAAYECSMYGFGGKYKGDGGDDGETQDLTKDNPAAEQLLKSLGF